LNYKIFERLFELKKKHNLIPKINNKPKTNRAYYELKWSKVSLAKIDFFKDIIDYAYNQLNSTSEIGVMEPTEFHKLVQVESMYLYTTKLNNLGFKPSKNIYQIINNLIK
jgi:hypothetical protein